MRPNAFCRCFVIVVTLFTQHATALRASLRTSNPVTVASVELLGNVNSTNTYVFRDLGFQGTIGGKTYLTYGDTNYEVAGSDGFHGIVSDSIAMATSDPLKVTDMDLGSSGWPNQFCPLMDGETSSTDAMGITNVVETIPGSGILYFLKNHRPNGVNQIIGAGVANITFDGATPVATRLSEYWWDGKTEPWYGDVCAFGDGDYVYAYGHGPTGNYTFVTRALKKEATDLNSYEYWNGATWQTDRLTNPTSAGSVFWQADQGQVIFSKYYNAYMFVYTGVYLTYS